MPYFPLRVSIPEPCHEDWNLMTTVDERQRHCAACDRTLTDFSAMSDPEIVSHLRRHEGKLCGRFRKDQLERKVYPHPPRRYAGLRAIAASAAMLLSAPVAAQTGTTEPTEQRAEEATASQTPPRKGLERKHEYIRINGVVSDETGETLIGASILINGTTTGTVTDIDGRYTLLVPLLESVTLTYSYTGFKTKSETFRRAELIAFNHREEPLVTTMLDYGELLGGIVVTCYWSAKPTRLENIMAHKIFTYKPEKPADYDYGKKGDWKDYWRELFAKRKARRAERKEEHLRARAERRALMKDGQPNPAVQTVNSAPASAPVTPPGRFILPAPLINLQVSPNPFQHYLNVSVELTDNASLDVHLVDANGRLLKSWQPEVLKGKQQLTLDLEEDSIPAGAYFLRVVSDGRLLKTVTLVR